MSVVITQRLVREPDGEWAKDFSPLLRRLYQSRGVRNQSDLATELNGLESPGAMKDLGRAAEVLAQAIMQGSHILIVGDFDADGATSTALSVRLLKAMGGKRVSYLVPNRFEYGYGLTPEIVEVALHQKPDVLLTVDNGIASLEGVAAARKAGLQVVITDHHLAGAELPEADAIVNPNQPGCSFPGKSTAGVGVVFYVLSAVRQVLRSQRWFERCRLPEPNLGDYLDLVALGTVADVVPLERNNRVIVEQGLRRIRDGRAKAGIVALIDVASKDYRQICASDLGFVVGPRLNAAGRLDDMSVGIECLLTDDPFTARQLAVRLDALNQERKQIEAEMKAHAEDILKTMAPSDTDAMPWGVCLYDEIWHQGVIGILASRMKDRLHRPVIAFAPADDGAQTLKGSARSIAGLHIRDALDAVATRRPDVLSKFGGHAMAAGLSIEACNLNAFQTLFDAEVRRQLQPVDLTPTMITDGELAENELSLAVAEQIRYAGPWGQQFPEPLFEGVFKIVQSRVLSEKHLKLVLGLSGSSLLVDAIAFNTEWAWRKSLPESLFLVYRLDVNFYRGNKSLQLMIDYIAEAP